MRLQCGLVRKAYVGMKKDIEDLCLAKCSTLYSAMFNNVHSYISWGLNFMDSPGHEIYAPHKFDTQNFCPMKISTITVYCCFLCHSVSLFATVGLSVLIDLKLVDFREALCSENVLDKVQ